MTTPIYDLILPVHTIFVSRLKRLVNNRKQRALEAHSSRYNISLTTNELSHRLWDHDVLNSHHRIIIQKISSVIYSHNITFNYHNNIITITSSVARSGWGLDAALGRADGHLGAAIKYIYDLTIADLTFSDMFKDLDNRLFETFELCVMLDRNAANHG